MKKQKKLRLSKEKIRLLSEAQLGSAAGGDHTWEASGCTRCPTPWEPIPLPIPPPPPSFGPPAQCWP